MAFIIAQMCGIINLVITATFVQCKTKEKMLIFQIISNSIDILQYLLLNAITGGIIAIINTVRCMIFFYYKKKNKKPSIVFLMVFVAIAIISGIMTWQNIFSIIPIVATIAFTYGIWQDNVQVTRMSTVLAAGIWIVYNIVVCAYAGALQSMAGFISAIIAIMRDKKALNGLPKVDLLITEEQNS